MIPKSRNNGNDCDYIYLDALDGDDAKNVLSFEKKNISKNSKTKILKLLEKNHTDGKDYFIFKSVSSFIKYLQKIKFITYLFYKLLRYSIFIV